MKNLIAAAALAAGLFVSPFLLADMVNLNKADAATLQENLKGIGEKKAEAIVAYRKAHGDFRTVEEIKEVKGIGEGIFKKIKADLSLTEGAEAVSGTAGDKGVAGEKMKAEEAKPGAVKTPENNKKTEKSPEKSPKKDKPATKS